MTHGIDYKIALLLPYEELLTYGEEITSDKELKIYIEKINSQNVEEISKKYEKIGVDIIISRGNLAKKIKKIVDVEIVTIELTGYEFFETLYKCRDFKNKIAVVENKEFIYGCSRINSILGLKLDYYQVDYIDEFKDKIQKAIYDGNKLIIGGSFGIEIKKLLNEQDVEYELVKSLKPSVEQAIDMAVSLFFAKRREKDRHQLLNMVLNFSKSGIVVVNDKDEIINVNPVAKEIFQLEDENIIGEKSQEILPNLRLKTIIDTEESEMSVTEKHFNSTVVIDRIPMSTEDEVKGAIAFINKASEIVAMGGDLRRDLSKTGLTAKYQFCNIAGESDKILTTLKLAKAYSKTESTILLLGETGTGKELFAQSIHNSSSRKDKPFVAVNCAALPTNLLESELFGYDEGAFTGAKKTGKPGLFELAHKGTLFLDEIGEIDMSVQTKLLRVLQEHQIRRVGDTRVIPVDVRIIAATNRNLYDEIRNGNFRSDLFYRINILNLSIPPLRDRKNDIKILINKFLSKYNQNSLENQKIVSPNTIKLLEDYYWPGNVRELENVVERIVVIYKIGMGEREIHSFIQECCNLDERDEKLKVSLGDEKNCLTIEESEKNLIERALQIHGANKSNTAKQLGIDRTTLLRKIKKYNL